MHPEKSILTVLQTISDQVIITPKGNNVVVGSEKFIDAGLRQDETISIIALLQDDARCIRVIDWPARKYRSRFANAAVVTGNLFKQKSIRTRHSFSLQVLPSFTKKLNDYRQRAEVSKPTARPSKSVKKVGALTLHEDGSISCNSSTLILEPKQRALAKILTEKYPYLATYDNIIDVYWNEETDANYLDSAERDELLKNIHASKNTLLRALKSQGAKVDIENVRGTGYKFLA